MATERGVAAKRPRWGGRLQALKVPFRWPTLSPWWRLVTLCVAANLVEIALVLWFDHNGHPGLAPQASAVAPYGVFHDLRWISVYHNSWLALVAEILAMLLIRGALIAASVSLAWPAHLERPSVRRLLARGTGATALAAVLLVPSVLLLFGLAVVPVSWLFLAAVPTALLIFLIVHPVAVTRDWWRRTLSWRALGWIILAFAVYTAAGALIADTPGPVWVIVAVLTGLFSAWCWVGVVHAVVDRRSARYPVPVVPVALIALIGIVIGGTVIGFTKVRPRHVDAGAVTTATKVISGPAVLVISGYGSVWNGHTRARIPGRFGEQQFSYRGLDSLGRPLPYRSADTVKTLAQLDRMFAAQVEALYRATGGKVDVVAESEGSLVAKTALMADHGAPVDALVLISPLVRPGRVSYPPPRASGWGLATRAGMQLLAGAFQSVSPINLSPSSPFMGSVNAAAPVVQLADTCPLGGVRQFAILPLADATTAQTGHGLPFPSVVVAGFHGGLLQTPSGARIVSDVLNHRRVNDDHLLRVAAEAIGSGAGAWQVPDLARSYYAQALQGSRSTASGCRVAGSVLHAAAYGVGATSGVSPTTTPVQ